MSLVTVTSVATFRREKVTAAEGEEEEDMPDWMRLPPSAPTTPTSHHVASSTSAPFRLVDSPLDSAAMAVAPPAPEETTEFTLRGISHAKKTETRWQSLVAEDDE